MKRKTFLWTAAFLLILLWVYAAASKLVDWDHFKWEMHDQRIAKPLQTALIYLLPPVELLTAGMLITERYFLKALYLSLGLMVCFAGYIVLVLNHVFKYIPCACGGILEKMGWTEHLYFNLFWIALISSTIIIYKKGGTLANIS